MPPIGSMLKAGFAGLKGAGWGKIGEEAWGAVSTGFSKRALTGAAVGAVGGAAKGAIVDYGEQGQPLFSSLASNALKGGVMGGLAFGVGGGLLGKGGKAFRGKFNEAFNGFRTTVGKTTGAGAEGTVARTTARKVNKSEINKNKRSLLRKLSREDVRIGVEGIGTPGGINRPNINLMGGRPPRRSGFGGFVRGLFGR